MSKERFHHFFPQYKKRCPLITTYLLLCRRSALVLKEKKRSFERILEACLHGASSLWFRTSWSSISFIFGSHLHLTHEILNHTYPPMPLNTGSPPMGKRRKDCVAHPNSIKIILESIGGKVKLEARIHWMGLSTPRHQGCSLSNHC